MHRFATILAAFILSQVFFPAQGYAAAPAWHVFGPVATPSILKSPQGIAVDAQGNVLIADTKSNYIVQISASGKVLARWGSAGSRAGQFKHPYGVAAGNAGAIYVADGDNNRIQMLSPSGRPLRQWRVSSPVDVAVGPKGTVFVSDGGHVLRFNANGKSLGGWPLPSEETGDHLAVDGSGRVYVHTSLTPSNTNGKGAPGQFGVVAYSAAGKQLDSNCSSAVGSFTVDRAGNQYCDDGGSLKKFSPSGKRLLEGSVAGFDAWAVAPDGTLYGLKSDDGTIVKLSTRLTQLAHLVPGGASPPGAIVAPRYVTTDRAGRVYVVTDPGDTIQKYAPSGRLLAVFHPVSFGEIQDASFWIQLAADRLGNVDATVLSDNNQGIEQLSPAGRLLHTWSSPDNVYGLTFDGQGNVLVSVGQPSKGYRLSADLKRLSPGPLASLTGCFLTTDRAGNVYLGNDCSHDTVVRKVSPAGRELHRWSFPHALMGLAVDATGNLYTTRDTAVDEYASGGRLLRTWKQPLKSEPFKNVEAISFDPQGNVLVADHDANHVYELRP